MNGQTFNWASHIDKTVKARQRRMPQTGEGTTGLDTGKSMSDAPSMQWRYSAQAYWGFEGVALLSIIMSLKKYLPENLKLRRTDYANGNKRGNHKILFLDDPFD
jgi:hypothetical protein